MQCRVHEQQGQLSRARNATEDRKLRIGVAGRGRVSRWDEALDQRFILRIEPVIQSAEIISPLFLGARARDDRHHELAVEHPVGRELSLRNAALVGVVRVCGAP